MRALRWIPLLGLAAVLAAPSGRAQLAEGGARALGLGRAATALPGEAWAEFNPAAPASLTHRRADLYASQAFGLSELRLVAASVAVPLPALTLAVQARTYGFAEYRETQLGLAAARGVALSPTRRIDLGLRAAWQSVAIEGFGSSGTLAVSLGAQVDVAPGLRAGFHARNASRRCASDAAGPTTPLSPAPALAVGLAFQASPRALVLLDAVKDLDFPVAVRAGLEVEVVEALTLRGGAQAGLSGGGRAPTRLTAGLGLRLPPLRADLAVEHHEALGLTP